MNGEIVGGELSSAELTAALDEELQQRVERLKSLEQHILPHLVIINENLEHKPSQRYVRLKQQVGVHTIGMAVSTIDAHEVDSVLEEIHYHNELNDTHGIIVQLPLKDRDATDEVVAQIAPEKDVDGLGPRARFRPATPLAIMKLLEGHHIDYRQESVAILGRGRLVGGPLEGIMQAAGVDVVAIDDRTDPMAGINVLNEAGIIISAMGQPGLVTPDLFADMSRPRVLMDAGAAEQAGVVKGDVSDSLRTEALANGWLITPEKGGLGPLTVRTLLGNVVQAAEEAAIPDEALLSSSV